MLLSLSWLREFTPYEGSPEALGDRLTMLGLEMEDIVRPYRDISDIVVGHVVACAPHPESDHLHVCRVDAGLEEALDIVCGAPNVADDQKVPVALVGTRLPDGTAIKKAKLRGAPSFGMICSERELGFSDSRDGIMVLPQECQVGARLVDAIALDTEVLDISVTPNRADCLSILGLARETALAFDLPLHIADLQLVEDPTEQQVLIDIQSPDLCRLYAGRVIAGVSIVPAPMRVRHRLHAHGVRSISNIVDATNYILLECGQPLHAFDLDRLEGGRIVVKRAGNGEKITTLDGQERILARDDLCICDARRAVALAGVMGGLNSEITEQSRTVFLESAVFKPEAVRKTSRRLGLSSEASYRFERGIDQQRSIFSLNRACAMIATFSGGRVLRGVACAHPTPFIPARITYRPARANALLGIELSREFNEKSLLDIGCAVEKSAAESWLVSQPSWRPDITREADLIEEVGRLYGLDAIPSLPLPVLRDGGQGGQSLHAFWSRVKHWAAGLGLNEAVNYSFVGHKDLDHLGLPEQGRVSVLNPLSAEQDVLRTALAPGLLQTLRNNLAQGAHGLRIFELAYSFEAASAGIGDTGVCVCETGKLAVLLYGARYDAVWPYIEADADYADIKGIVEHLLHFLRLPPPVVCAQRDAPACLLPCVDVRCNGEEIGQIGRLKPALAEPFHACKDVWLAELNLDRLRALHDKIVMRFAPLPVYPPVRRDITVIAGHSLHAGKVLAHLANLKNPLLVESVLTDVFEPEGQDVPEGERRLTFRLTFRHPDRTLKDAEVDRERENVANSLKQSLGVRI
ncbi:MAG: phenylalanyl-tRNA synthetase subunit beta [Candidatus Desulfovibrio kirbyi]|uniref:Phenylalanine--tRNA ligase beta subunit n=1 Tax=Candidatus Desulfovibrio kirbyi TaxID=2696086 RepID=A0A6L2R6Z1_9BACT|nr:MAG: phenylalanyl-tRNA synthetase subunit beta [Candidatus Desulfovibrio kirbyi]